MVKERKNELGGIPPWEFTTEERNSIWGAPDSDNILNLARTLPWQLEELEAQGIFRLSLHLLETGDPWSDPVNQLISDTKERILIQSSRVESGLPFPITPPTELNSSLPEILDADFLEGALPEKIIQCLIIIAINTQQKRGKNEAYTSGEIEARQTKLLCQYFTIIAVNYLKRERLSTEEIAKFVFAPQSEKDLKTKQGRVQNLLNNRSLGGFGQYTYTSDLDKQLRQLKNSYLIPRHLAINEGASSDEWLNNARRVPCLNYYTRPRRGIRSNRFLLQEIGSALESPKDLLPVIFLMAVGKWALIKKRLDWYKTGKITVEDPEKREENIKDYQQSIAECQQLAQEMINKVFTLSAPKAIIFFESIAETLSLTLTGREKFEDLRELLDAAQELLTEEVWNQLKEASPDLAVGFRQEALSHSGQRKQP